MSNQQLLEMAGRIRDEAEMRGDEKAIAQAEIALIDLHARLLNADPEATIPMVQS